MIYEYDGSFEGFLCCVYESYVNKEFPIAFAGNEEFPILSFYSVRSVETDLAHSGRVMRSITALSPRAARLLYRAFHTCMADKEVCLYRFVQKLYTDGPQFIRCPSDDTCLPLFKAVRHLSGELESRRLSGPMLDVRQYIYDMPVVMAAADLVISRAGASTLSELTALGMPTILVPSPYVVANHQEKNARLLERHGGAVVLTEPECTGDALYDAAASILASPEKREAMARAMKELGIPDATERIYDAVTALVR